MNVIEKLVDGARHRVGQVLGRAVGVEADFLSIRAAALLGGIGRDVVALHYPSGHPPTVAPAGMSITTPALEPTRTPSPSMMGPSALAPAPTATSLPRVGL